MEGVESVCHNFSNANYGSYRVIFYKNASVFLEGNTHYEKVPGHCLYSGSKEEIPLELKRLIQEDPFSEKFPNCRIMKYE